MKNILVVYASGYGSTAEVAQAIGGHLTREEISVTVKQLPFSECLDQYDAVVVGSAIRYDRWMPAAKAFVLNNKDTLERIPVAYFFCCLTLAQRTKETENKANQYAYQLYNLAERINPSSIGQFAGVLDIAKMPLLLRIIFRIFGAIIGLKPGDYRNWQEIQQWSDDFMAIFSQENGKSRVKPPPSP